MKTFLIVIGVLTLGFFTYFSTTVFANNSVDVSTSEPVIVVTPVTYDDVLARLHRGQWFGWRDSNNKIYKNLVVLDPQYSKPTESELLAAMTALQSERDSFLSERTSLQATRSEIEARILAGTYDESDFIDYLRILGGF